MRTDDGHIVQECLNGESTAFGILVDKYKAGIYAFVYDKLRNFHDAQDVTQEVFLQAYSNLRSLRRWESFGFWLYRIARNQCGKWTRTQSRRLDRKLIEGQDSKSLEDYSLTSYRDSQLNESLREALDSLPESYREALILRYFGDMNSREIARVIGASPTAIRMRLSRAREQLKEEMTAMMGTAFEGQRLQASFTFRIVEIVKRLRIQPTPRTAGLPWGLSLAAGIIITVMSVGTHLDISNPVKTPINRIPSDTQMLKTQAIPVDILVGTQTFAGGNIQGNNGNENPDPQMNALMAPQDKGGSWAKKADMLEPRDRHPSSVVNGKIYVIGGGDAAREPMSFTTVQEYDPVANTWSKKTDMPTTRLALSTGVVDGIIYAIGGWDATAGLMNRVEAYDPSTDTWSRKANMPTPRFTPAVGVVDGIIYAIGGGYGVRSVAEAYDPSTDTWTKKANMPTPRQQLPPIAPVVDGKIYVIGGGAKNVGPAYSAVEVYDPVTDKWEKKTDMPTPRWGVTTTVVNGKIYAIGGFADGGIALPTVEVYDPQTDTWTQETDMPTPRARMSASVVNGQIYVIGGIWNGTTVEAYDTGFREPQSVNPAGKLPATWGEMKSE